MRVRRSTMVVAVALVATLSLYLEVRPPPAPGGAALAPIVTTPPTSARSTTTTARAPEVSTTTFDATPVEPAEGSTATLDQPSTV